VSLTLKVSANFVKDSPGSSEMNSWALSIIAGIDFSFKWLFLVDLEEPFLDVSEAKYLAATSYTVDLGLNWFSSQESQVPIPVLIILVCERPAAKTFDYCRSSIILRTRSYLLGHFKVMHAYYKLAVWLARTTIYCQSQMRREFKFKFVQILVASVAESQ